jgi:ribosomal protein L35AE/L33A
VDVYAALCIGHFTQGAVIVHGNSGVAVANFTLNLGVNLFSFDFLSLLYHIKFIKSIVFYVNIK